MHFSQEILEKYLSFKLQIRYFWIWFRYSKETVLKVVVNQYANCVISINFLFKSLGDIK